MEIRVRLFAALKEKAGIGEKRVSWAQGLKCGDILNFLKQEFEELGSLLEYSLIAINGSFASRETLLSPNDELAILPPVSGG